MKYAWLILFLFIVSCSHKILNSGTSSGVDSNKEQELRILSYNIHHASPPSKPGIIDLEAIAKVIRDHSPDLVALQEVDVNTKRSGTNSNQAAELARLSGMPYFYFARAIDYDGGEYGLAIISRFPMDEFKNTQLPTAPETKGELRTLARAVIHLPGDQKFLFANTHLDAQKADTNRYLQINKIEELLKDEKLPLVIAGDFNATPDSRIINLLDQHFTRSCLANCGFTIPVEKPVKTIDFIAYRSSSDFSVKEHKVIEEFYASDHLPVFVVLQIKQNKK